jgi:predicted acetyltransferase
MTATDYLDDYDILVSYFHITINKNNKYFINYMYTNKNYRNKGYMNKLLMYALDVCKEKNIKEVYSWTKLSNKASQNTFLSNNFTDDDITFVKKL